MYLFKLLLRELRKRPYALLIYSAISGGVNAALIGIINTAAETVSNSAINWQLTVLYALCLGIIYLTKRYVLDRSSIMVETVVNRIRHSLANKVRHTELSTLENRGTSGIYARISQDATSISNASTTIINGAQESVLIIFTLLYISTISLGSFVLIVIGIAIGVANFISHSGTFNMLWMEVSQKETEFFDKLDNILKGFKEISLNRLKNERVFNNYTATNNILRKKRIKTSLSYNTSMVFTQIFFYILLGVILFVLPKIHAEHEVVIVKVVTSVLFIVGPLEALLFSVPLLANADNAANNILTLEEQLKEDLEKLGESEVQPNSIENFKTLSFKKNLTLNQLTFQYPSNGKNGASFQVGPIDLEIQKGELIFITGGNGSGKSTFLKLFTGLYKPTQGSLIIDKTPNKRGTPVTLQNYQQYQNLLSTIFSDYHLFDKLYGIPGKVDAETVNTVLGMMELPPEKVTYSNETFSTIKLSSGQKKRLALTTAIMEDKEIYIFDEVAADLDPAFRDKFYYKILPALKKRGKTLFVVSHDQQYWNVPDRMLQFQDGKMKELSKNEMKSLVEMAIK